MKKNFIKKKFRNSVLKKNILVKFLNSNLSKLKNFITFNLVRVWYIKIEFFSKQNRFETRNLSQKHLDEQQEYSIC